MRTFGLKKRNSDFVMFCLSSSVAYSHNPLYSLILPAPGQISFYQHLAQALRFYHVIEIWSVPFFKDSTDAVFTALDGSIFFHEVTIQ